MQKYIVRFGDEILDDITELYGFYLDLVDEASAERFRIAALQTIDSLITMPDSHPMWRGRPDIRRVNMPNHKVAIIYIINDDVYEVIAIAAFHELENPARYAKMIRERL